jgi:thiol-disulfide isomerase/thioredoxin
MKLGTFVALAFVFALAAVPALAGCGGGDSAHASVAPASMRAEERVTVLDFHAPWCGTCKKQEQVLAGLAADPALRNVEVVKVDFDTATEEKKKHRVGKQSTLVVLKGDKEVARATGLTDPDQIRALIAKAL